MYRNDNAWIGIQPNTPLSHHTAEKKTLCLPLSVTGPVLATHGRKNAEAIRRALLDAHVTARTTYRYDNVRSVIERHDP